MSEQSQLDDWFLQEVMPLEPALMRFLRRNWRQEAEIPDLRQDLYLRLYEAGRNGLPRLTKPFVFNVARNLLINRARRGRVISIEIFADMDGLAPPDVMTPDRHVSAREELRRLQEGLDRLPSRCREVVVLRRIEGLSQREAASRMGISEETVEKQLTHGMRALVDFMLGGTGALRRGARAQSGKARRQ